MNNYDMLIVVVLIFIMLFSLIILYNKSNIAMLNIFIVIIILFNVYYWFYYRKMIINNCEKFETVDAANLITPCGLDDNCIYTVNELEKSGNNDKLQYHTNFYNNTIANTYSNFTDVRKGDPLLAYNCIKISPVNLYRFLRWDRYGYKYSRLYIKDDNTLVNHIKSELETILATIQSTDTSASKIKGPVYAIIAQSPYLRYKGNVINARFDTTNNKYSYYDEVLKDDDKTILSSFDKNKSLYVEIVIIFPSYKTFIEPNVRRIPILNREESYIFDLDKNENKINQFHENMNRMAEPNNAMCFLKCNNSFNLTCGCLNSTPRGMMKTNVEENIAGSSSGPEGENGYVSKCSNEQNKKTDYSMMYFLNPYNPMFNSLILNHLQ